MPVLNERTAFPPHHMTESEKAAIVGRFVMLPTAVPDPPDDEGQHGRNPAAPHGVVYVRDFSEKE